MTGHLGSGFPVGVSFVFLLYFLLPGIAFVKAVERGEREVENLSRLDKLGYIMAGGTASMFIVLLFDFVLAQIFSSPVLRLHSVAAFPLIIILGGVVMQSTIGALIGYRFGRWMHDQRNPRNARTWEDREQPWRYISDKIRQQPIIVITTDGQIMRGVVSRYGSGSDAGDVVLGSPKFIGTDGEEKEWNFRLGNEAFLSGNNIAQIHYTDEEYFLDDDIERSSEDSDSTEGEKNEQIGEEDEGNDE